MKELLRKLRNYFGFYTEQDILNIAHLENVDVSIEGFDITLKGNQGV